MRSVTSVDCGRQIQWVKGIRFTRFYRYVGSIYATSRRWYREAKWTAKVICRIAGGARLRAFVSGLGATGLVFGTSKGIRSVPDAGSRGGGVDEWRAWCCGCKRTVDE